MDLEQYMQTVGKQAKIASKTIAVASSETKNITLKNIATILLEKQDSIIFENSKDIEAGREKGLDNALLDRLLLNKDRIKAMASGVAQIAELPDPIGEITNLKYMPSGIQVGKMRAPLGVIGMIYESRPNVTADAAALCLKSGNAIILRGGSEAIHSNSIIAKCIYEALENSGLPKDVVQVITTTDREAVNILISMDKFVDVIIPRGGKGLVKLISEKSTVPVIKHLDGICHVYIDDDADINKAIDVAVNSKTHRYGVCNAMETLLVAKNIAQKILPVLAQEYKAKQVELRGCSETCAILTNINPATQEDWSTEYLAPILSIKIVDDIQGAIDHIEQYSSGHTESIVSNNYQKTREFIAKIDSSSVMVNASTRFADGFEYGLGAEMGISTDKIHVRGPVGLEGLTSQKYVVFGDGHIRT